MPMRILLVAALAVPLFAGPSLPALATDSIEDYPDAIICKVRKIHGRGIEGDVVFRLSQLPVGGGAIYRPPGRLPITLKVRRSGMVVQRFLPDCHAKLLDTLRAEGRTIDYGRSEESTE